VSRRRHACLPLLALAGLLGGCGDGGLRTERPPHLQTSAVIWECGEHPVVRPRSLTIACADGNTALSGLRWHDWGAETATAGGRIIANPCLPTCVADRQQSWPVEVTVRNLVIGTHHAAYATVIMIARGHHPHGTPRRLQYPLETSGRGGRS